MSIVPVDNNGREGAKHDGAAESRTQKATRHPDEQDGSTEFQRSSHEMEPARVAPFQVFLVDGRRSQEIAH